MKKMNFMVKENEVVTLGEVRRRFKELEEVLDTATLEETEALSNAFDEWACGNGFYFVPELWDWFDEAGYNEVVAIFQQENEMDAANDQLPF